MPKINPVHHIVQKLDQLGNGQGYCLRKDTLPDRPLGEIILLI